MVDNQIVIIYTFGFYFNDKLYCWKNKQLYRIPFTLNLKSYSKRLLKQQHNGSSYGYWIDKCFKSMKNLKEITQKVNYKETIIDNSIPF